MSRKYLPTFAELVDRLSIVQLKEIFLPERRAEYRDERRLIMHDIDTIIDEAKYQIGSTAIHAIMMLMLTNRYIWENESKARAGGDEQDRLLKLTHSINGVRATARNVLAKEMGERTDLKVDCFAAELLTEYGNWDVFSSSSEPELASLSLRERFKAQHPYWRQAGFTETEMDRLFDKCVKDIEDQVSVFARSDVTVPSSVPLEGETQGTSAAPPASQQGVP